MNKTEDAINKISIAVRDAGVSVEDVDIEFKIFSATLKLLKERYHPLIY
jgi:hypothetical protein